MIASAPRPTGAIQSSAKRRNAISSRLQGERADQDLGECRIRLQIGALEDGFARRAPGQDVLQLGGPGFPAATGAHRQALPALPASADASFANDASVGRPGAL